VETAGGDAPKSGAEWLQWGHAFVSVETAYCPANRAAKRLASMGPRFCKRGNITSLTKAKPSARLQWGHAFVSVETRRYGTVARIMVELQWGHAFVSLETHRSRRDKSPGSGAASMGPRFCKRGNTRATDTVA